MMPVTRRAQDCEKAIRIGARDPEIRHKAM